MPAEERFVVLSGRRTRLLHQGSGPPLLLIHGIGASADFWEPNIPSFAAHFEVCAVDLPGCGKSGRVTEEDLADPGGFLGARRASV